MASDVKPETETEAAARLCDQIRKVVEDAHAAGIGPKIVSGALAYELAAEIAFGSVTELVTELGAYNEAATLHVIDEYGAMLREQVRTFGPKRHA